jgi:lambda family phage tail tape measure protein
MADLRYQVQVDTAQAQQSLARLKANTDSVGTAMLGLKSAIAGLALGAMVRGAAQAANAMTDLSAATGVSVQTIQGLSEAFGRNGASAQVAQDAILRISQSIGNAAEGSKKLTESFDRVGVSLQDIDTLSESDILRKTIDGLGRIPDAAERSRLAIELLGKSVRTVDFAGLSRDQEEFVRNAASAVPAIEAAGQANQNFANAAFVVQTELLKALQPLSELAVKLTENTAAIGRFIETAKNIAIVVGSVFLVTRAVTLLFGVFRALSASVGLIVGAFRSLRTTFAAFGTQLRAIAREGGITQRTFEALVKRFEFLGKAAAMLGKGLAPILGALTAIGTIVFPDTVRRAFSSLWDTITGTNRELEENKRAQEAATKAAAEAEQQRNRLAQQTQVLNEKIAENARRLREAAQAYNEQAFGIERNLRIQNSLIGAGEQQIRLNDALRQAESAYLSEATRLQNELARAKRSANEEERSQIPLLLEQLANLDRAYRDNMGTIRELVGEHENLVRARNLEEFATRQQQDAQAQLTRLQRETARLTMTELERKYYDIANAADDAAAAAIRAEEARRGAPLSLAEQEEYYRRAREGNAALIQQTRRLYNENERIRLQSRTFSAGWQRAWKEYRDAARDSSRLAENIFRTATQGMEDAIVNFAKTGKFEWKSMVADMAEQLLRSQIQKTIASIGDALGFGNLFGGKGSASTRGQTASNPLYVLDVASGGAGGAGAAAGGNLLGSLGSIFGGSTPGGTPGINPNAGGSGGSIFGTIGSVLGSVGSSLGTAVKTVTSSIGNVVGGLVSGVKNLFGGFFATGGTIPRGKFGVVGERGPELISGPADITPMGNLGGGVTNVTYNISAVDAISFQQLVARDPGFIHAVAMQGARGMPVGRR